MDERRLADIFQDAVGDLPPASFTEGDIRAESRRQTVRKRNTIALGSALGIAVLATGIAIGPDLLPTATSTDTTSVLAEGSPRGVGEPSGGSIAIAPGDADGIPGGPPPADSIPEDPPTQRSGQPGVSGSARGCAEVDRELAGALANELPDATGGGAAYQPLPVGGECPSGSRAVSYLVRPNGNLGFISAVLLPADQSAAQPTGFRTSGDTKAFVARTSSGKTLVLRSDPREEGSPGPYLDSLQIIAQKLATTL